MDFRRTCPQYIWDKVLGYMGWLHEHQQKYLKLDKLHAKGYESEEHWLPFVPVETRKAYNWMTLMNELELYVVGWKIDQKKASRLMRGCKGYGGDWPCFFFSDEFERDSEAHPQGHP